jgi:hypothetical protein
LFIQQDFNISYPFLSNDLIDLGLNHTRIWPESLHPKKSLKHLLTRKISSNLIYRQKQGFLGPLVEKFSHPVFIKHLDQALDPGSIFSHILSHGTVYKMREYLISQQNLSIQTYNFLWAVTFVHRWLTQLMENHETIKKRVFPG